MNVPRRDGNRPKFERRSGIVSSADIEAAVKASGIKDDDETTGPTVVPGAVRQVIRKTRRRRARLRECRHRVRSRRLHIHDRSAV